MAFASLSKPHRWKSALAQRIPGISLNSQLLRFCSSTEQPTPGADHAPSENAASRPQPEPRTQSDTSNTAGAQERPRQRTPRGKARNPEKLEDIICRMMANRAWTTRLQNSIRALVPEFDHSLVYNVLHGARNSEDALQFFRWVERAGLFRHDRETHLKIIEFLGRASKLNHARCILLDMPKKGVEWDED